MEAKSDLLHLRRKFKSTILSSTFSTNKRTDNSLMAGVIPRKKSHDSSFLECLDANFPKNEFFIFGQSPFSIIAKYHEEQIFANSKNMKNKLKLEDLFLEKFRNMEGGPLVINFEIDKNHEFLNKSLCCEVIFFFYLPFLLYLNI